MKLRALVLAAGLGRRLRPLTEDYPKPALPVLGRPILAWTLDRLRAVGCEAAAVNLYHRGDKLVEAIGDEHDGMPVTYSQEDELKGTLGAAYPLKDFFAGCDAVLVINGDSLCRWPLKKLVREHRKRGAAVTLLLTSWPDIESYGGGVGVAEDGRLVSFFEGDDGAADVPAEIARRRVFAGAHVFDARHLERVREEPTDFVRHLYIPLRDEGALIQTLSSKRRWHDLGTPRRYLDGTLDWARGRGPARLIRRSWVSPEATVAGKVKASVVEPGAAVAEGARIESSLLLPGSRVEPGATVEHSILGPGAVVPEGARIESRLVSPRKKGYTPNPGDTLVGGMVYASLDPAPKSDTGI
jgi:mannose-1-phosphate guanylyltransferase